MLKFKLFSLIFVLGSTCGAAAAEISFEKIDGSRHTATVKSLDSNELLINVTGNEEAISTAQILSLATPIAAGQPDPTAQPLDTHLDTERSCLMYTSDGSRMIAKKFLIAEGSVSISDAGLTTTEGSVSFPAKNLQSVVLQGQRLVLLQKSWDELVAARGNLDLLVVEKDGFLDYYEGIVTSVTATRVEFDIDEEVIPVKRSKVFGIIFRNRPRGLAKAEVIGKYRDGSGELLNLTALSMDRETLRVTSPLGFTITHKLTDPFRLDFSVGKLVYLGDIAYDDFSWNSALGAEQLFDTLSQARQLQKNIGLTGNPLSLDGKTYKKGVAMQSKSRVAWRLQDKFSRLKATVGIDDAVRPGGNLIFRIFGDNKMLHESQITGQEQAKALDLDITGVQRIIIEVDYGEALNIADHLNLVNLRLVK